MTVSQTNPVELVLSSHNMLIFFCPIHLFGCSGYATEILLLVVERRANVFVFLNFSFCFIIVFVIIFFTQFRIFWTLHNYVHLAGVKLQTGIRLLLAYV